MIYSIIISLLKILSITIPLLLAVAFFTVAERKIMGAIQRRRGPNVIGFIGLATVLNDSMTATIIPRGLLRVTVRVTS